MLGSPATISSVGLSGPSSDLRAIITLSAKDVQALASAAVEGQIGHDAHEGDPDGAGQGDRRRRRG